VGQARGGGAGCSRGGRAGVVLLLGPAGGALDAAAQITRKHQAGDRRDEVGGGPTVGWRPDLQEEVAHAEEPETRRRGSWQFQETCLAVLPDQDGALPDRAVPQLDEEPTHPAMLVVPVPDADPGPPLQGVPGVEAAAEDPVGGGEEGDREVEGQVEGAGPPGRREVQPGGAGLPHHYGSGENSAGHGRRRRE